MNNRKLRVLVACEESQAVCLAFRALGHEAFSCDLLPCSGGHPEWHYQQDVMEVIDLGWDLMIAHPPCTFVAGSAVRWLSHPEDKHLLFDARRPHPLYPDRRKDMEESIEFFKALYNANIKHIAIENPVGLLSSKFRKPDQIIQPYEYGHEATKTTCLWLKNLPQLIPTDIKSDYVPYLPSNTGGKNRGQKYLHKSISQVDSSKTFEGIAKAMASQWSEYILGLQQ